MEKGPLDSSGLPGADEPALAGIPGTDEAPLSGIPGAGEQPLSGVPGAHAYPVTEAQAASVEPGAATTASSPSNRRPQLRIWIELVVAAALAVLFMLLVLGSVIDAAHPSQSSHVSRSSSIVLAVISAGLLVLCGEWARHAEHRLHKLHGHPLAVAFEAHTPPSPPVRAHRQVFVSRRHNRYSPRALAVIVVVWTLFTFGMLGATFFERANADRSNYVQHHGISASGIVTDVNNIQTCGRGGCSYHALISVQLSGPVNGATHTVVHYPGYSELVNGDEIRVLVDPKEVTYAEIPGSAATPQAAWIVVGGITLLFALIDATMIRRWVILLRQRRTQLAFAGVTTS